jgi:hypothetical protein
MSMLPAEKMKICQKKISGIFILQNWSKFIAESSIAFYNAHHQKRIINSRTYVLEDHEYICDGMATVYKKHGAKTERAAIMLSLASIFSMAGDAYNEKLRCQNRTKEKDISKGKAAFDIGYWFGAGLMHEVGHMIEEKEYGERVAEGIEAQFDELYFNDVNYRVKIMRPIAQTDWALDVFKSVIDNPPYRSMNFSSNAVSSSSNRGTWASKIDKDKITSAIATIDAIK